MAAAEETSVSRSPSGVREERRQLTRSCDYSIEDLKGLNDQRKILLPDNLPPSPPPEPAKENGDVKMSDAEDLSPTADDEVPDSEDEVPVKRNRSQRRENDRKRKRDEEAERKKEKEKKEAAEQPPPAKVPKQSKQFQKILKDIEKKEDLIKKCEDEIAIIDNDLREADCPRTRVLGKDRFWNRYYWFERNGMPYGGLPNSSTAAAGYANGCIWVQGPDELEREGYIDMPPEHQGDYKAKFDMTVPERKKKEEGKTSVFNARQWGFFSEPGELDGLLEWLDPRGFNELKLRKELVNYRDKIVKNMENRRAYLAPSAKEEKKDDPGKRISARTRLAQTPEPPQHRCLQWQNTMALEDLGHLHSEQPPPARPRKQSRKKEVVEVAEPKKPRLSRQGSRYNF